MIPQQLISQFIALAADCAASLTLVLAVPAMAGSLGSSLDAATKPAKITPKPSMRWNSFDSYGV